MNFVTTCDVCYCKIVQFVLTLCMSLGYEHTTCAYVIVKTTISILHEVFQIVHIVYWLYCGQY